MADNHRLYSTLEDLKFKVGDRVWLFRRNVKTTRPCNKLDYQCLSPQIFINEVNEIIFGFIVPPHMRHRLVFHHFLKLIH